MPKSNENEFYDYESCKITIDECKKLKGEMDEEEMNQKIENAYNFSLILLKILSNETDEQ
ncbi:MAG: hypothetical protein ACYDCN_16405 [Bacteroidia bacterium]